MTHRLLTLLLLLSAITSCTRRDKVLDARVDALSALADVRPDSALHLLDSMAPMVADAPEASRMRHALATVKARDKAYITHTSDSMILPVIKYYADRPASDTLRPVAFYYAGRVYSDIGDAPQALDYFQQALDAIPDSQNIGLRSAIHAQMGGLFRSLLIPRKALKNFKKEFEYENTLGLSNDMLYSLLGISSAYGYLDMPDSVRFYLNEAIKITENIADTNLIAYVRLQQIRTLIENKEYKKADSINNSLQIDIKSNEIKCHVWSIVSYVDYHNHRLDESLAKCKWLEDSGNIIDKRDLYLLMGKIYRDKGDMDNAIFYISSSINADNIEELHKTQNTINHADALYNYSLKEKENQQLKEKAIQLQRNIALLLVLTILLISILIVWKRKISYQKEIITKNNKIINEAQFTRKLDSAEKIQSDNSILDSPTVENFLSRIKIQTFTPTNEDWEKLTFAFRTEAPNLYRYLNIINHVSDIEWKISMLIRLEVSPTNISRVLHKSPSSVTSIRARLYTKILGRKASSAKDWDKIIRSL